MTISFDLAAAHALLGLSEEDVRERLGATDGNVRREVAYERLKDVTEIYRPETFPGRIYLRNGSVELVYVPYGPALDGLTSADLEAELGKEGEQLRSRAGKTFTHYVHAQQGVAYTADSDDAVEFVEVFGPRTLEAYRADIYEDPGDFIR